MHSNIAIISLNSSSLAKNIAQNLKVDLLDLDIKLFASKEIYIRLKESVRGKEVFVVHSFSSNVSDELISLFVLLDCLKRSFAKTVHVFLPYFPYARQDRVNVPREPISAKLLANLLDTAGADHVIACELHSPQIQGFFNKPMDNINLVPLFEKYLQKSNLDDAVIVAVDVGGAKIVKDLADRLDLPMVIMHKVRPSQNEAEIQEVVGEVEGKNCIIFDDMVDTGGSVIKVCECLRRRGAKSIRLAAVHSVLSNQAMEKLSKLDLQEIIFSNTLSLDAADLKQVTTLDIAAKMAKVFKKIDRDESVTEIINE